MIREKKSVLIPDTRMVFLGFQLDSVEMTVSLTSDKKEKVTRATRDLLEKDTASVRDVAGLIGLFVA